MVLQSFLYNMLQFSKINQDLGKDVSGAASKDAPNIDAVANMGLVDVSFVFLSTHTCVIYFENVSYMFYRSQQVRWK